MDKLPLQYNTTLIWSPHQQLDQLYVSVRLGCQSYLRLGNVRLGYVSLTCGSGMLGQVMLVLPAVWECQVSSRVRVLFRTSNFLFTYLYSIIFFNKFSIFFSPLLFSRARYPVWDSPSSNYVQPESVSIVHRKPYKLDPKHIIMTIYKCD